MSFGSSKSFSSVSQSSACLCTQTITTTLSALISAGTESYCRLTEIVGAISTKFEWDWSSFTLTISNEFTGGNPCDFSATFTNSGGGESNIYGYSSTDCSGSGTLLSSQSFSSNPVDCRVDLTLETMPTCHWQLITTVAGSVTRTETKDYDGGDPRGTYSDGSVISS